jgi:putative ABC transport system permease protein
MLERKALRTSTDPVLVFVNNLGELGIPFETLRSELLHDPNIKSVGSVASLPWMDGGWHFELARRPDKGSPSETTIFNQVGYHFFDTLQMRVLAGRALDKEHGDEIVFGTGAPPVRPLPIVIDRSLARALGWNDPNEAVNQPVYGPNSFAPPGAPATVLRVVGVVEDGYPRLIGPNTASNMYGLVPPLAGTTLVRVSRDDIPAALRHVDATWNSLAPKIVLRREFMDTFFNLSYQKYSRVSGVLSGLSAFAFFIAVMGLCGLAIHVTSRRKREIGIRKTLGASARGVVFMLLLDFAKPVLVANLIAWPFAYFAGRAYLNLFVERAELTAWPFALSLAVTVGIAWAAVAVQALRAAAVKPANVLYAQ